jgi:hypothetical protein
VVGTGLPAGGILGRGEHLGSKLAGDIGLDTDGVEAGGDRRLESLRLVAQIGVLATISRIETSAVTVAPP